MTPSRVVPPEGVAISTTTSRPILTPQLQKPADSDGRYDSEMPRSVIALLIAGVLIAGALGFAVGRATGDRGAIGATPTSTATTATAAANTVPDSNTTTTEHDDDRREPETAAEAAADYEAAEGFSFEVFGWSHAFDETVFDFDGDGDLDILIQIHNIGDDPIWLQTDDGFVPSGVALPWVAEEDWIGARDRHGCDAADIDLDGDMDLYCSRGANQGRSAKSNELWIQDPPGTFTEYQGHGAEDFYGRGRAVVFLNLDGDAYPDLYVTNSLHERNDDLPNGNAVYRNNGDLTFSAVDTILSDYHGSNCTPAVGDWNGDGFDDLAICSEDVAVGEIYENDGAGGFIDATSLLDGNAPAGRLRDVELVDLNGDGWLDLVWIAPTMVEVYLNHPEDPETRFSERYFRLKLEEAPYAVAVADLNRDGVLDLYVAQGGTGCSVTADPPNGHDVVLLGPDFGRQMDAPFVRWGCARMAEAVGPEAVLIINGLGNNEGPFTIVRPSGD